VVGEGGAHPAQDVLLVQPVLHPPLTPHVVERHGLVLAAFEAFFLVEVGVGSLGLEVGDGVEEVVGQRDGVVGAHFSCLDASLAHALLGFLAGLLPLGCSVVVEELDASAVGPNSWQIY